MKIPQSVVEIPDIVVLCRQKINIFNFVIVLVGAILIAELILFATPQETILFTWFLSISWIILMILYTYWRFTGIRKLYISKVKKQGTRGIRLLLTFEYFSGVLLFCLLLIWVGIPTGTNIYLLIILPLVCFGSIFVVSIVPTGIFTKDILK
jgi:hypothetical protein